MKKYIYIFITLVGLLYTGSFIFWSYYKDPFYWFDMADHYDSVMTCFYLWIGNLWKYSLGTSVLRYRSLGWLLSIVSFTLPYFLLLSKTDLKKYYWSFVISMFFFGHGTQGMFNPDSLTLLFFVIITIVLLKDRIYSFSDFLILGLLTGMSIASRFPNIVSVVIISGFMIVTSIVKKGDFVKTSAGVLLYITISLFIAIFISCILCGDCNYVSLVREALIMASSSDSQHVGMIQFLGYYISTFTQSMKVGLPIVGICSILVIVGSAIRHWLFYVISFILIFSVTIKGDVIFDEILGWKVVYSLFISFLLIFGLKDNRERLIKVLLILSMGLACTAGSDTGLMKMHPFISAFAPFAFIVWQPNVWKYPLSKVSMFSILLFSIVFFLGHFFFEPIISTPFKNERIY